MKIEKRKFTAGPLMEAVLKAIPVYPDAINANGLRKILHVSPQENIARVFDSFPSSLPICEDNHYLSYVDEDAKKFTFKAYGFV